MWTASNNDLAFIAAREACVLKAYPDAHSLAIGFGINDKTLKPGDKITYEEAIRRFVAVAADYEADINKIFGPMNFQPHEYGALFILDYNIGGTKMRQHHLLLDAAKAYGDQPTNRVLRGWVSYYMIMSLFSNVTGVFNPARRYREATLFETGDYGNISRLKFLPAHKTNKVDPYEDRPMPKFK